MSGRDFFAPLLLALLPAAISGCGNNSTGPVSTLAASQSCLGCHSSAVSSVTGAVIADEWKLSTHNTKNGASCADCHEPDAGHPNSCGKCHGGPPPTGSGHDVIVNAEQAQKCYKCHGPLHPSDIMMAKAPQHFGNMTASTANTKFRASYVSSNYAGNCRKCHNPHDPSSRIAISRQWAESGLGDTKSSPRTVYDFKTRGTYQPVNTTFENYCVRCHTTTGFINYAASGFTDQRPFAGPGYPVIQYPAVSADKTKEVTGCDACHDDGNGNAYSFKVRAVSRVRVYYNYSSPTKIAPTVKINDAPVYYPDAGSSNLCVACHTGRGTGTLIKEAAARFLNFSGISAINAHAFAGGSIVFKISGYEYDGRNYANPQNYTHERIGMNNFMNTGARGPCITCHMKSDESHSFVPVRFDPEISNNNPTTGVISAVASHTCAACHNGTAVSGTLLPPWSAQTLQERRAAFHAALASLNALLSKKKVPGTPANWERLYGKGTGPDTMGAYFNYNLLKNDWGAYAHNDFYTKRLIYDSIDWLYDGDLNATTNAGGYATDVEAAINSLTTAKNPWNSAYTYTVDELARLKADAVTYLLGAPGGSRP